MWRRSLKYMRIVLFVCLSTVVIYPLNLFAIEKKNPIGLDFPALLDESIKLKGSLQDGLLTVSGKHTWETLPQNHEEMVRCVDKESQWTASHAGFSTVDKIWDYGNSAGEDENYTLRYSGYFYVDDENVGTWTFCTYSNDASEIEIDGWVVTSWYGEHDKAGYHGEHRGTIELKKGWHQIVYRYAFGTGRPYSRAEFKNPTRDNWEEVSTEYLTIKHYPFEEGILLLNKKNMLEEHPDNHDELKNCVESSSEADVDYFGWKVVDAISHDENIHGQDANYTSYYETYFEVTESDEGDWEFSVNSGSASEIEIDEAVVASWYGDHASTPDDYSHAGTVTLTKGWHKLVFRQETLTGAGSSKAFFKKPSDTDWKTVSTADLSLKTFAADFDLDGIHNDIEAILGTDMENPDSDFESLNDYAEIFLGSDPLKPDSNDDGLPDTGEVAGSNYDPDGDGIENLWDDDNDGDGIKDGADASPFAKTEIKPEFHFEVATTGKSTYLDFQLKPKNPMNLMLFNKKWDWPYDEDGQMQDRDNSTEDVQLIPMLELTANLLPNQDHVEENGINVTTDGKVRSFDGDFTHNDGMGIGNVFGDDEKEVVTAGDRSHKIVIKSSTGEKLKEFDSVFSTGDKLFVADVINNGYAEILVFHDADHYLYLYSGEGHLIGKIDVDYHEDMPIAVGDIVRDGKADIVIPYDSSGHVHIAYVYKSGLNLRQERFPIDVDGLYAEGDGVGLSDIDGDGKCEVLIAEADDDRLHIYEYYETDGWNWHNRRKVTEFDFDFDLHDGLMGAEVLISDDPDNPRYGEEILLIKPDGHIRVYTEAGPSEEDRLNDTGFTEFDGYTAADIVGDDKKEIVITSDTTGVVNIYNANDQKAYVPLAPITENGITVAFQGRMIYTATGEPVKLTADARLVWFVVGKTDSEDDPSANETTVLAKYREDFSLTGFSATEYRSVSAAIVHKDNKDAVSNAYMMMNYKFLYGDDTFSTLPDAFSDVGIDVDMERGDFEHEYTAEKWINETLKSTVLANLPDGKFPVAVGIDSRYASSDLAALTNNEAVATGDRFSVDLASKEDATSRTIKMNWYDTTLDSISPMEISAIYDVLIDDGYSQEKVDMAIANISLAGAGEESYGDKYSPLKRDGLGILIKSGVFAGNAFMAATVGNFLVKATKFKFQYNKMFKSYNFKIKWMKSYNMAKKGGAFAKFGKHAGKISKIAKIGGPLVAVAFAAYTFYSIASSSGWSNAGMLAGAMYAGMQGTYFMALALISSAVPGGPVIAGLLVISDIITWAITGSGWSDRLMTWIAAKLTEVKKPPKVDIDFGDPSVLIVDYDENGFDVGDRLEFKCRATETISKKSSTWTSDMRDSYVKPYAQFYDSNSYTDGSYRYEISNSYNSSRRIRVWDVGAWVEPKAADLDFSAKVKLTAKMKVYYRICTGDECDRKRETKYFSYGDTELVFDVMPGSLEDFLNWPLLTSLDKDSDGIDNTQEGASETWRSFINTKKTDNSDSEIRLRRSGVNLVSTGENVENAHFRLSVANDDGQFRIISRSADAEQYLRADTAGVEMTSAEDDQGLWDIVPVIDDLYHVVNVKLSEDESKDNCLLMPADNSGGEVLVKSCDEEYEESLWKIVAETSNTVSNVEDTDGDKLPDRFERDLLNKGVILDGSDPDMDDDGLTDLEEILNGTNPLLSDSDGDGISDKDELLERSISFSYNTVTLTKKVKSNPRDPDSDGDGLTDSDELNANPPLNPYARDTDGDGIPDNLDDDPFNSPDGPDTDFDRLSDQVETEGWEIIVTTEAGGETTRTVASIIDDEDSDDDTLSDWEEYKLSDPQSNDTDADGITDQDEKNLGTDALHFDTDRDGLSDGYEISTSLTDPKVADTDKDGLGDGYELESNPYATDPLHIDTDSDGLADSDEINSTGTNPTVADTDSDGLSDGSEIDSWHTDPLDNDSDDDTLTDGNEILTHNTDPLKTDTDDDQLSDADEVNTYCSNATRWDTDRDGLNDYDEIHVYSTTPCDYDSDNDGLSDGQEITLGSDPQLADSDGDLIDDGVEVNKYGTDPNSNDTDGDGLADNVEIGHGPNVNGLGTNPTEADTDNDGITDEIDPDTYPIGTVINDILVLYDEIVDPDKLTHFTDALGNIVDNVNTGTPDDYPDLSGYPFIVLLGEPDGSAADGSVAKMIYNLTDEVTRTNMLEDPYRRFSLSAVEKYTGLPAYSGDPTNPEGSPPEPTGPQVDMNMRDSLVVMLTQPYDNDAYRALCKFIKLKQLYWNNYVMEAFTTTNPYTNPVTEFELNGITNTNATVNVTLSGEAAYAAGSIVAYTDMTSTQLLRSDDLDQGDPDITGDEDVMIDQYIYTEASAYIPTTMTPPLEELEEVSDPVASSTLRIYYSTLDLDRSLPRDNDITDMLDIDESTLSVYQWNGLGWDKLSADLDWVTSVTVNTDNITVDPGNGDDTKDYEGYVDIVTNRSGLFCLAGQRRPDTTSDGSPAVSDVFPSPDAVNILLTSAVTVTFNEDITEADFSGIAIDGVEIDSVSLTSSNVITITPEIMVPGVTYTVTIPANSVEDLAGVLNSDDVSWAFTTIAPINPPFANNDYFSTDENTDLTDINIMEDNGDGADYDDEEDPLTVVRVNGDENLVGQPVAGSLGGIFTISSDGTLTFSPNGEFEHLTTGDVQPTIISYTLSDGNKNDIATVTVTVDGVNNRPVMSGESRQFTTIDEDAGDDDFDGSDGDDDEVDSLNNYGKPVSDLLIETGSLDDVDSLFIGMAITSADQTNGQWQYSSDGYTWVSIDRTLTEGNALLLASTYWLRFLPEQHYSCENASRISFKAWDQSDGSVASYYDSTSSTACSTASADATIDINVLNDPPQICVNEAALIEPGETVTVTSELLNECDPDDDGVELTYIVTDEVVYGELYMDSNTNNTGEIGELLAAGDTFTQDDIDNNLIIYTHDGSEQIEDSFTFSIADGGEDNAEPSTGNLFRFITRTDDDSDNDGMPDWWEILYHLDPDSDNADLDSDGDGMSDLEEYERGRNPERADAGPGVPVLISPSDLSSDQVMTTELTTDYQPASDQAVHNETQWQVAADEEFSTLILDRTSGEHLTSLVIPHGLLSKDTLYFWRVRYIDNDGGKWNWSDAWSFTTAVLFFTDENDNNIPDDQEPSSAEFIDLDGDGVSDPEQPGMKCLRLSDTGGYLSVKAGENVSSIDLLALTDRSSLEENSELSEFIINDMLNIRLSLIEAGVNATLDFYVSEPLPGTFARSRYDTIDGWHEAEEIATDNSGRHFSIKYSDDSAGDTDGVLNGICVDFTGIAKMPVHSGGGSSCFISTVH